MKLIVAREAAADFERLHAFLADKSDLVAQRAVAVLDAAVQSLQTFPERGRPSGSPGVRELIVPFGQSSYVVRYAHLAESDEIVIVRIWHGREARE